MFHHLHGGFDVPAVSMQTWNLATCEYAPSDAKQGDSLSILVPVGDAGVHAVFAEVQTSAGQVVAVQFEIVAGGADEATADAGYVDHDMDLQDVCPAAPALPPVVAAASRYSDGDFGVMGSVSPPGTVHRDEWGALEWDFVGGASEFAWAVPGDLHTPGAVVNVNTRFSSCAAAASRRRAGATGEDGPDAEEEEEEEREEEDRGAGAGAGSIWALASPRFLPAGDEPTPTQLDATCVSNAMMDGFSASGFLRPRLCLLQDLARRHMLLDCHSAAKQLGVLQFDVAYRLQQHSIRIRPRPGQTVDASSVLSQALSACDVGVCGNGCAHGAMVAYTSKLDEGSLSHLLTVCDFMAFFSMESWTGCMEGTMMVWVSGLSVGCRMLCVAAALRRHLYTHAVPTTTHVLTCVEC